MNLIIFDISIKMYSVRNGFEMKILIINSSVYGKKGQTETLLDWVKEFFAAEEISTRYMCDDRISPCTGCNACVHQQRGKCQITDSMDIYRRYLQKSDLIVIGAPIYVNFIPAKLKSFFERLRPFNSGKYKINDKGFFSPASLEDNHFRILVVSTCGFPEIINFEPSRVFFDSLVRTYDFFKLAGSIYIPAFKMIKDTNPELFAEIKKDFIIGLERIKAGECFNLMKEYVSKKDFEDYLIKARVF